MLSANHIKQKKLSRLLKNTWQSKNCLNYILSLMLSSHASAASLNEVIDIAIKKNLAIKIAEQDTEIKAYDKKTKISGFLPSLSLSSSTSWNSNKERLIGDDTLSQFNTSSHTLSLSQNIINIADIYSYKTADIDFIISELDLELEKQKTIEEISSLYLNILKKRSEIRALYSELKSSKSLFESIKKNVEIGNKPGFELYEVASKKEKTIAGLIEQKNTLLEMENEINSLLQTEISVDHDITETIFAERINSKKTKELNKKLPQGNIEILKSNFSVIKEEIRLKESLSAYYPTLSANISYTYNKSTADNPSPTNTGITENTVYSLSMKVPIFSGGTTYLDYKKRTTELSKSQITYQDKLNESSQKLNTLIEGINTKVNLLSILKNVVETSELSLSKTRKAYEMGARTITDLLSSESSLYQSIKSYNKTRYEYLTDLISLEKETGNLNSDFIATIDKLMTKRISEKNNQSRKKK